MLYKIKTKVLKQCIIPSSDRDGKFGFEVIRLVYYLEGDEKYCVDLWMVDENNSFLFYDSDEIDNDLAAEAAFEFLVKNRLFMSHCPVHDGNDIKVNFDDFVK